VTGQYLVISLGSSIFIDRDGSIFGHLLEYLREGVLSVADQDERPSSGLLRRLKRNVDFFDTMIAEAKRSEDEANLLGMKACASAKPQFAKNETGAEVETKEKNDDGIIMNAVDNNGEARLRNSRGRDSEGKEASAKKCYNCLQYKSLGDFHKCGSQADG
jgi:hypothetical protein